MASIYAIDGLTKSPFIGDVFYTADFEKNSEKTIIIVTGEDEKDCVELLGNLQEKYGEMTYHSVVPYDDLEYITDHAEPFEEKKASEQERKYVNSYENPEYRDYWGLNDEPDEPEPPEPEDYPDLYDHEEETRLHYTDSERIEGLRLEMFNDGSGCATLNGERIAKVDLQTREYKLSRPDSETGKPNFDKEDWGYDIDIDKASFLKLAEECAIDRYGANDPLDLTGQDKLNR